MADPRNDVTVALAIRLCEAPEVTWTVTPVAFAQTLSEVLDMNTVKAFAAYLAAGTRPDEFLPDRQVTITAGEGSESLTQITMNLRNLALCTALAVDTEPAAAAAVAASLALAQKR